MTEHLLLGIYVPIVVGGLLACMLWVTRWLIPKMKEADLDVRKLLLGLSSLVGMFAHAVENSVFGTGRWMSSFAIVNELHWVITAGKVFIVVSIIFAVAAFAAKVTWGAVGRVAGFMLALWALGTFAAWLI